MTDAVCHVTIEDEPRSGAWNMAIDEALLEGCIADEICRLRLYRWSEPTISLGYFQKPEDRPDDPHLVDLPVVRRLSGGGAVLHDREITYAIVVPRTHRWAASPVSIYAELHEAIVDVLDEHGIAATLRGHTVAEAAKRFLCFTRGDEHDIVIGDTKVVGSAQRRRRGVVLQHGSVVLSASDAARELPGIEQLCPGRLPDDGELAERLAIRLTARIGDVSSSGPLPACIEHRASQLLSRERVFGGATRGDAAGAR